MKGIHSMTGAGKETYRRRARLRRGEMNSELVSAEICRLLVDTLAAEHTGGTVAGYIPIRNEVSPFDAMCRLHDMGFSVCVPVVIAAGTPLEFWRWEPDMGMVEAVYGTRVPEHREPLVPDVLIVPLLAFDREGWRLGYGGGFYDRTIECLRMDRKILTVGIAGSIQGFTALPHDDHDQQLDAVVTEEGFMRYSRQASQGCTR